MAQGNTQYMEEGQNLPDQIGSDGRRQTSDSFESAVSIEEQFLVPVERSEFEKQMLEDWGMVGLG